MKASCVAVLAVAIALPAVAADSERHKKSWTTNTPAEVVDRRASKELLRAERYAELDAKMNGIQQKYASGSLSDEQLLHAFAAFDDAAAGLQPLHDAWVEAFPKSYAARLARGIYFRKAGAQTRGGRFISHTTYEQLRGMDDYFEKARSDLRASTALERNPLLSYVNLIAIESHYSNRASTKDAFDAALAFDPKSIVLRHAYMRTLQTRWGGSLQQMRDFVDVSRSAGVQDERLKVLSDMVASEETWLTTRKTSLGAEASAADE